MFTRIPKKEMKVELKTNMDENRKEMEKKMEEKMNENSSHVENKMDNKMDDMKNKMDKNKEEIQKSMKELKKSMSSIIFHALDERNPKGDLKIQGNHENKENRVVETRSHIEIFLSLLESTNFESQNHDHLLLQEPHYQGCKLTPMNYFIPKIDMRKFDGKDPIT
jgi:transcriptional regulator of heat shock response